MEPKLLTAERFVDMTTECNYRYILSDTEFFRPHYHDYCEMFLVLEGQAVHLINGNSLSLKVGDLIFIRPHDTHDYISKNGKPFSLLNITFTYATLEALFSYLGAGFPSKELLKATLPPAAHLPAKEIEGINARIASIGTIPLGDTARRRAEMRILLFDLFTRFFSEQDLRQETMPAWLEELCRQMRKKGRFIEGSEALFRLTDKSREHVSRSIKKHTGMTVTEFINDLRLNYIADMLLNSDHSATDIIFESGFNNISWATDRFKKKYGMTMSAFRRSKNI